jgi:uncharacterized protein YoxC
MAKADGVVLARQAGRGGCDASPTPLIYAGGAERYRPAGVSAGPSGEDTVGSHTLALLQVAASPAWVGPTIAISLALIALCFLGVTAALGIAALRLSGQVKKLGATVDGLQDDVAQALGSVRRLTEQGQDLMVLVRHEAGALAQTSRRVRRKLVRGVDRVEDKLTDLETLYDLVHGEVEDAALDVAATLRSVRRGNGMISRMRRMLVAGRS